MKVRHKINGTVRDISAYSDFSAFIGYDDRDDGTRVYYRDNAWEEVNLAPTYRDVTAELHATGPWPYKTSSNAIADEDNKCLWIPSDIHNSDGSYRLRKVQLPSLPRRISDAAFSWRWAFIVEKREG